MNPQENWERAKKRAPYSWIPDCLDALCISANVGKACEAAHITRNTAYVARKRKKLFAKAWDEAIEDAYDRLEAEAWRRGHDGVDEPVYQGGQSVGTIRRYSDNLLSVLLRANRPAKFRDRRGTAEDPLVRLDLTVDSWEERADEARKRILDKLTKDSDATAGESSDSELE